MPLYEYQCESCGHRFEKIQKFSDPPIEICPKCGGHVHKLISSPAFQFKGTGWYVTDYAKKDSGGGKSSGKDQDSGSKDAASKDGASKDGSKAEPTTAASSDSSTTASTDKPATKPS